MKKMSDVHYDSQYRYDQDFLDVKAHLASLMRREGPWHKIVAVKNSVDASRLYPELIHWLSRLDHAPHIRHAIYRALCSRFAEPWLDQLLARIDHEKGLEAQEVCLAVSYAVSEKSANRVFEFIKNRPRFDCDFIIIEKLAKLGVSSELLNSWLPQRILAGETCASLKRFASSISNDSIQQALRHRFQKEPSEFKYLEDIFKTNKARRSRPPDLKTIPPKLACLAELWSIECDLIELKLRFNEIAQKFGVSFSDLDSVASYVEYSKKRDFWLSSVGKVNQLSVHVHKEDLDVVTLRVWGNW